MNDSTRKLSTLQSVATAATVINLLLCSIFFPLVPLLGWLNYGHANWTTAWIPDVFLLTVIPAAYYLYWHLWFVFSLPALAAWGYLYRRSRSRLAVLFMLANGATVVVYWLVRAVVALLGIRPDSV